MAVVDYKVGDEVIFREWSDFTSQIRVGKITIMPDYTTLLTIMYTIDSIYLTHNPIAKANKFFKRLYDINEK